MLVADDSVMVAAPQRKAPESRWVPALFVAGACRLPGWVSGVLPVALVQAQSVDKKDQGLVGGAAVAVELESTE